MNEANWKRELHRLLDVIEHESTASLRTIKKFFQVSGRLSMKNFANILRTCQCTGKTIQFVPLRINPIVRRLCSIIKPPIPTNHF